MEVISLIFSVLALAGVIVLIILTLTKNSETDPEAIRREIRGAMQSFGGMINENQREIGDMQTERFTEIHRTLH